MSNCFTGKGLYRYEIRLKREKGSKGGLVKVAVE
jgi:hypothetical protein